MMYLKTLLFMVLVRYSAFVFAIITFQSLQTIATLNVKMGIIQHMHAVYTGHADKVRT